MPFALTTFHYLVTDPDILNPASPGTLVGSFAAGTYVEAYVLVSDIADQPGTFELNACFAGGGLISPLGQWEYNPSISFPGFAIPEPQAANVAGVIAPQSTPRAYKSNQATDLRLHFTPTGADPTFFQGEVVMKAYS